MKMKKWLKCLLMTMALMMVVNVGTISTTIPAAAKASAKTIKVGTKFQSGKFQYKVTSLSGNTGTATLIGTKSKKLTSVNVPETVKKGKYTLTVDAIGDNAFKNCKKLKSVATNTKIKKIGKNAFKGCKKLATVNIKSTELKSVGKDALKGISKKAVVSAPAGTADSYEDMLGVDVKAPAAAAKALAAAQSAPTPKPAAPTEKAVQTEAPATEAPKTVETEAVTEKREVPTETEAVETETPETEAPETEAPETETPETEAPKMTEAPAETTAPVPTVPKKAPTPKKANAPQATETETQKQTETEAQKQTETETQKQTETETQKQTETETQKQTETETQKQTETETPETKAPETEPETEAPKETEHVCEFDWVVTKEPYCGYLGNDMTWRDTGSRTGTCKVCGKVVKEGLRAEHQFVVTKDMEPTCTTRGATYSKCTICGCESITFKDENGNIRKALGHNMVHHVDPATCTEDGHSYDECSRCGLVQNEQVTEPKLGHDFTPETVTEGAGFRSAVNDPKAAYIEREPSCTLVGVEKIPCQHDDCGEVKTKYIPATGHDLATETIAATCSTNEKIVTTCTKCDYTSTQIKNGTKLAHQLEVEETKPSTVTEHGYIRRVCMTCSYSEKDILPLEDHKHKWTPVSELGEKEGILASMSGGKMRTERCTYSGCLDLRYTYDIDGSWLPWEEVPCNGKGHTWDTENKKCSVCGMTKPGHDAGDTDLKDGKGNAAGKGGSAESRIVWSIYIKTEAGGTVSGCAEPTAISSDHCIDYPAPKKDGYVFDHWSWSRDDDINEANVFAEADNADRSKLHVSCDYMNVTFIAHYRPTDSAVTVSEPAGTTQTIHGTMEIDLGLGDGSPAATHEHEVEEHHEALHEGENMTEMPSAPAEAVTESSALEEAVTE